MEVSTTEDPPRLIEYMVLCGVKPGNLVDYLAQLDDSALAGGLTKEALKQYGLVPEVLSMYPQTEKKSFPLSPNFADVSLLEETSLISIVFPQDTN